MINVAGHVKAGDESLFDETGWDSPEGEPPREGDDEGRSYDWIDDAFDDSKPDPLAAKGMTGCSRLAVVLCVIAAAAIIMAFVAGLALLGAIATGFGQV